MMRPLRIRSIQRDGGFTLVEVTTSVGLLLVVLTAAWMLLTTSGENLSRIQFGSEASEANRLAMAAFGSDIRRAAVPPDGTSPIIIAEPRSCGMLANTDSDAALEMIVWHADDEAGELVRTVTQSTPATPTPVCEADFAGGATSTQVSLEGLAGAAETAGPLFTYAVGAKTGFTNRREIGLVRLHLRNGRPASNMNVVDRSAAFRVVAFVINGY